MTDTRLRLCVVTPYQSGGGAEYQIACLLRALADEGGWDAHLLTAHPDPQAAAYPARVHVLGSGRGPPRLGYVSHWRSLDRALDSIRPHVIYQRVACGYTGLCAAYGRRAGVPVVWHVAHDSDVSADASLFAGNPLRRFLEKRAIEFGLRRVSHIVTQTRRQASLLRANYGREESAVIPNFQPAPAESPGKPGAPVRIVWIANFKSWKRPEIFVRLAAQLADRGDVEFVMVGSIPSSAADREWTEPLKASMSEVRNLRHLGSLPQDAVNRLLSEAHVLVNTSTEEGFPNTFIQAWMRGVPVVSLDVDPDGVIAREEVGSLAGSEAQLALLVRRLIDDPALRERVGERARSYALRNHALDNALRLAALMRDATRERRVR